MSIYLYLDIETVPDDSRKELWGLPEPITALTDPDTLLKNNANEIAGYIKDNALALPADWLEAVWDIERENLKARSTVLNAIQAAKGAEANLIKELSTDPERCKVVAVGLAIEEHEPEAQWVGKEVDHTENGKKKVITLQEKALLNWTWDMIAYLPNTTIVGYNILGFDLPVICARSILLDVEPSVQIDWRKYGNYQIIDLMLARFATGGKFKSMKDLARQYGIQAPLPDVDGSMVHTMTPEQIGEYVKSDIVVTRELHRKFAGYFCPPLVDAKEEALF